MKYLQVGGKDMGIIIGIAIAAFILISWVIHTVNDLAKLRNRVYELDSDVDVALVKRYDLLKKQYDTVKMYCTYESKTLMEAIHLRKGMSVSEKQAVGDHLDRLAGQLQITMEAYPQLASSQSAVMLQRSIDDAEGHLQAARRLYNSSVTNYNNKCVEFPAAILAAMFGHHRMEYFKADAAKKNDFEIQLI